MSTPSGIIIALIIVAFIWSIISLVIKKNFYLFMVSFAALLSSIEVFSKILMSIMYVDAGAGWAFTISFTLFFM